MLTSDRLKILQFVEKKKLQSYGIGMFVKNKMIIKYTFNNASRS